MNRLRIDIETYCDLDLKKVGVYRYVEHPSFLILMAAWSLDGGPVRVFTDLDDISDIPGLWDDSVTKVAHNAQFERICFSRLHYLNNGGETEWPVFLTPEPWHDTMAIAAERGRPQGLDYLAKSLGAEPKDTAGTRLINIFSKPNRFGKRVLPEDRPLDWMDFLLYCAQDVSTLIEVDDALGGWNTETEHRVYITDQLINDRGLLVDVPMARAAVEAARVNEAAHVAEITKITGIANPNSNPQMMDWFARSGFPLENLQKETVEKALSCPLRSEHRRVLELRQELALVASKKFQAALSYSSRDHRLRGQFRFFGAHTGRWTGRGVQPQNLPREAFKAPKVPGETDQENGDRAEALAEAAILDLKMGNGADALTLKKLVRPMFTGPFTVVDYAAIEARVIAWLANETWALEAFSGGRDIYVETADRMSTPDNPLNRSQGKVAVLALGYNGGVVSLRAMGAEGTNDELQKLVHQWRRANPRIVRLWEQLDEAFYRGGSAGPVLSVEGKGNDREIVLPSGRSIAYHQCRFTFDKIGRRRATFASPQGFRADTYGGRLAENATQAVARDLLAEALVRLEDAGHRVVGHVHDEILVEGDVPLDEVTEIMTEVPSWAEGLPVGGAGFTCRRYRKG